MTGKSWDRDILCDIIHAADWHLLEYEELKPGLQLPLGCSAATGVQDSTTFTACLLPVTNWDGLEKLWVAFVKAKLET